MQLRLTGYSCSAPLFASQKCGARAKATFSLRENVSYTLTLYEKSEQIFLNKGVIMKNKIHGLISLLVLIIAYGIGAYTILIQSYILGILYIISIFFMFLIVMYSYCRKCICQNNCSHIIPGLISKALFKNSSDKKYTILNYIGGFLPLVILIVLPQYYLIKIKYNNIPVLLIIFWVIVIFALLDIYFFICKKCDNTNCPNIYH